MISTKVYCLFLLCIISHCTCNQGENVNIVQVLIRYVHGAELSKDNEFITKTKTYKA